jgi:hypothetical protein
MLLVDADHASLRVDERSAAVPRVDRRVRLDVDHRILGPELAGDGAYDPHRHRVLELERAPES